MRNIKYVTFLKKTLRHLFESGVHLPQGYRATTRRQFKFPEIPGTHFISLGRMKGWVDFSRTWSHPMVSNTGPLDWKPTALATRL